MKRKHDLLPRCFGKNKNSGCDVVDIDIKCDKTTCPFYRTIEQAAVSREKGYTRLRSLSDAEQTLISEKYYDGEKPWLETDTSSATNDTQTENDSCLTNQSVRALTLAAQG